MTVLSEDRVLSVVRAEVIPDAVALCDALVAGGIRTVELTFTTPDVLTHIAAAADAGHAVGVGTVRTADQARAAIDAGARFLVTPGISIEVAGIAAAQDIPFYLGAFTATEVMTAMDLGSTAVKIFPACALGPGYLKDLRGPFPSAELLPSGGIDETNAAQYLAAGAVAVCAGTGVVPPQAVAAGAWDDITARAASFVASLS